MRKNFPIRKAEIRANERAERLLAAKRIFGIGEQDNSLVDSIERPFIYAQVNGGLPLPEPIICFPQRLFLLLLGHLLLIPFALGQKISVSLFCGTLLKFFSNPYW